MILFRSTEHRYPNAWQAHGKAVGILRKISILVSGGCWIDARSA